MRVHPWCHHIGSLLLKDFCEESGLELALNHIFWAQKTVLSGIYPVEGTVCLQPQNTARKHG
jgi:hypothetical protein